MIQEKDFLYRVPLKNVLVTTPRQQVINPEILVDLEGGEFMHGNILDANSTNKLINQSVKDAVDNKLIESGYVTKDLLEAETIRAIEQENSLRTLIGAETSARTNEDENLNSKIKAEQTRAEDKEKEISDKLAIVDGDSNTEGSFRKAIADVIAAAPEDLDTLKEIADKLSGNDDLHTALNQAITEKADASALANEVTRATGAESDLQAAIDTKADAISLSNYVLTTALNQQVDTLNTAINAKQDAGNYIPYDSTNTSKYKIDKDIRFENEQGYTQIGFGNIFYSDTEGINRFSINPQSITFGCNLGYVNINPAGISLIKDDNATVNISNSRFSNKYFDISGDYIKIGESGNRVVEINNSGIKFNGLQENLIPKANGGFININDYALKTELPTVPTNVSQLTNDSNFMAANVVQDTYFGLEKSLRIYSKAANKIMNISHYDIRLETNSNDFTINENGFFVSRDSDGTYLCTFTPSGIKFEGKTASDIPTANGSFIDISNYATRDFVTAELSAKQNKITVNTIDVTDIETADVTKLRTIVTNLINALISSGLINATSGVE